MGKSTETLLREVINDADIKLHKVERYILILEDSKFDLGKSKVLSEYRLARVSILKRRNRLLSWFDYLFGDDDEEIEEITNPKGN